MWQQEQLSKFEYDLALNVFALKDVTQKRIVGSQCIRSEMRGEHCVRGK